MTGCGEEKKGGGSGGGKTPTKAATVQGSAPADVDLSRVHYQFASCDFKGGDLSTFERAINEDTSIFSSQKTSTSTTSSSVTSSNPKGPASAQKKPVAGTQVKAATSSTSSTSEVTSKEHITVEQADDGSIVGWVDRNGDQTLNSHYSLNESSSLASGAKEDSDEVVFRIRYDVNNKKMIYSDRSHKHYRAGVEELEDVDAGITNTMATRQHSYYKGYWAAPASWVYVKRSHEVHRVEERHHRRDSIHTRPGEAGGHGSGK